MISFPSIASIGTSVPEHKVRQEAFLHFMSSIYPDTRINRLKMRKILLGSGIDTRHSVLGDFGLNSSLPALFNTEGNTKGMPGIRARMIEFEKHALPLSLKAVDQAFNKAPWIRTSEITHVITFSCTGMYAPGLDIQLVEALGIRSDAERFNIGFMGCYAAFNAMKTAWHICRSNPSAKVLLSGVELCSLHFNNIESDEQLVANSLFSDGSAAVIMTNTENIPIGDRRSLQIQGFHSDFASGSKQMMLWNIGERAFDLRLSPDVPASICSEISNQASALLQKNGFNREELDFYAIHPGGVRILQACETGLGISAEQNSRSYSVLKENGNMSSVTVLFVLAKYIEELTSADVGKNLLSCAFGPGLTTESMIAKVN